MTQWIGKLMGVDDLRSINDVSIRFAAPWAEGRPVLVAFVAIALALVGIIFYFRYQKTAGAGETGGRARVLLAGLRAALLAILVVILAEPVIALSVRERPRPLLVWLFDTTDSMNLKDTLTDDEAGSMAGALADEKGESDPDDLADATRMDLVRKVVARSDDLYLGEQAERCRVRAYVMDRLDQVREIDLGTTDETTDPQQLADQLQATGDVTAIGSAIDDLARRHRSHLLAGVVVVSDFDQNAGSPAIPAAERLGAPIYAVGIGPREVVDLTVELQAPLVVKNDVDTTVTVHLRQTGLTGRSARVELLARRLGGSAESDSLSEPIPVAPARTVEIDDSRMTFDMPYTPTTTGRFMLEVKVDPFDGEVLQDNNSAQREITVRDESLKLYFVEYEPTWEWRFVKEVFHRDPLIGREGFRTYLRSADTKVKRTNDLFVESLVRPRGEFFSYDVIFLSDLAPGTLTDRFREMLREYVYTFGGGLVVIAGPRFGMDELTQPIRDTENLGFKLSDMLPVVFDRSQRPRNGKFPVQFTPSAVEYDFMNLGANDQENSLAWSNLGALPWYQPVMRPHPLATVLANIPSERCADDITPQPLIASRRYGKGEVVYVGFNEFWRIRRKYGEKYYRKFWGQLIYRLGLGRALGAQKRFQTYTDRPTYQAGDKVRVTVEAFNADFEPLEEKELTARLISQEGDPIVFSLPMARDNVYESSIPVYATGPHRVLVRDPIAKEDVELNFAVAPLAVEKRNAVRDFALQEALAAQSGGKAYELYELASLKNDLSIPVIEETTERRFAFWNTWLVLLLVLLLMHVEWLGRKLVNLR